jgi:hypothetical protein|nr:MAG TPA: major capsid protein [Caudoviricetes sp.]
MAVFDHKNFNENAFGKYVNTIPRIREGKLIKSGVLEFDKELQTLLAEQTGSHTATIPIFGRLKGAPVNYDGATNITANTTDTFSQKVIAIGRASGFVEKDFSEDITGGVDFMTRVAGQLSDYWEDVLEDDLIAVLEGIFATSTGDTTKDEFINNHTTDISSKTGDNAKVDATTLNSAIGSASGDKKNSYTLVIMHSTVATNLENLNLINYVKYTDERGITRDLTLGTWNGRDVIISDDVPENGGKYTTYVLGRGAIKYAPLKVKVSEEMVRDAKTNGGETTLISRRRCVLAPLGFSYKTDSKISPTNAELRKGENWTLVKNSDGTQPYPIKMIPIVRIVSKG